MSTKNHPVWDWIKEIPNACMVCGYTNMLQVHHIIPRFRTRYEHPANYLLVCQHCHMRCHGQTVIVRGTSCPPLKMIHQLQAKAEADPEHFSWHRLRYRWGPGLPWVAKET